MALSQDHRRCTTCILCAIVIAAHGQVTLKLKQEQLKIKQPSVPHRSNWFFLPLLPTVSSTSSSVSSHPRIYALSTWNDTDDYCRLSYLSSLSILSFLSVVFSTGHSLSPSIAEQSSAVFISGFILGLLCGSFIEFLVLFSSFFFCCLRLSNGRSLDLILAASVEHRHRKNTEGLCDEPNDMLRS